MSEMLTRVADAIDGVLGGDHESLSIEMGFGDKAAMWRAEAMQAAAYAAVEAMRQPTLPMCEAGYDNGDEGPTNAYRAMIDAALSSPGHPSAARSAAAQLAAPRKG